MTTLNDFSSTSSEKILGSSVNELTDYRDDYRLFVRNIRKNPSKYGERSDQKPAQQTNVPA